MPSAVKIQVLKDATGARVYRVAIGVGGSLSVVRDFKSKEEAERFVYRRSAKGQKRA